jgi:hypothetical protein
LDGWWREKVRHQPSAISHQPSAISHQPSAISQSVTTLDYHPNGTLRTVTGPANAKGERYVLNYRYDAPNQQYVTRIEDSFGYVSEAGYDYRFGQPLYKCRGSNLYC